MKRGKAQKGAEGAAEEIPAEVAARLQKAEEDAAATKAENAKLTERIQKMEDDAARKVFVTKAETDLAHLPGAKADVIGGLLYKVSKALSKDELATLESILKAADAAIKTGVLKEIGSEAQGGEALGAEAELAAKAAELRKADPKMTESAAKYRVLKSDSALQARINAEQDARVRKARG